MVCTPASGIGLKALMCGAVHLPVGDVPASSSARRATQRTAVHTLRTTALLQARLCEEFPPSTAPHNPNCTSLISGLHRLIRNLARLGINVKDVEALEAEVQNTETERRLRNSTAAPQRRWRDSLSELAGRASYQYFLWRQVGAG